MEIPVVTPETQKIKQAAISKSYAVAADKIDATFRSNTIGT
jgi:hypothetical protein